MATQARVTSVEAIATFMAQLINYRDKTRSTVEEITGDVMRTRQWLQLDQRALLENQVRRRTKLLEEAQQRLYSAELANLREPTVEERMAVRKAKAALESATEKLDHARKWNRNFESQIEPEVRRLNGLHTFLAKDMREAIASLDAMVKALEDYGEVSKAAGKPSGVVDHVGGELAASLPAPTLSSEGGEGVDTADRANGGETGNATEGGEAP